MKKYLVLLVLVLTILALCACGQVPVVTTTTTGGGNTSSSSSSSSSNVTTLPAGVYAVHYELDGGEQSQFNPDKYVHGQDTPIYSPTKTGHIFDGWFLSSDFSGAAVTNLQDLEGEITLYAKWTVRQVRVTYDLGLASAINHPDNVSSFSWQADGKVPVFEPVANGYIFDGWYRDKNFTGEKVTELDASKTSAVKLYAKWIEAPSSMVTTAPTVLPNHSGLELTPGSKLLVDMSTLVTDKIAVTYPGGVHAEYVLKENGEAVVRWNDPATRQQLRVFNSAENADLSAYKGLTFMLYNANPHGGRFVFCVYSGGSAKVYLITLDWTGWKQVFIDFGSPDWSLVGGHNCTNVDAFAYLNNGWTANIVTVIKDETGKTIGYEYTSPEYEHTYFYMDDIYALGNDSAYQPENSEFSDADFTEVKDRWRELLLGNATVNADYGPSATEIGAYGKGIANGMNTASDRTYLWSNCANLTEVTSINTNYTNITAMAKAWGTPGSAYYHNAELLSKIIDALTFLNTYDANGDGVPGVYGKNVSVERPGNWWNWQIGIPQELVNTLMIIENEVDKDFILQMLEPVDICCPKPSMTVANRTWVVWPCLGSAMLQQKGEQTILVVQGLLQVFDYVTTGDGFYEDGSYIQHNRLSYVFGYGSSFFGSISDELYVLAGTAFDIETPDGKFSEVFSDKVFKFFFDSVEPLVYRGHAMYGSSGRGMGAGTAAGIVASLFKLTPYASQDVAQRYFSTLKFYEESSADYNGFRGRLEFVARPLYNEYANRTDIVPRADYYFSHVFAGMDRVVAHNETFSAVLCMSSTRIYRYEAINGQGGSGWYLGDGALFIYDENPDAYNSTYFSKLDKLMIPGTTVSSVKRQSDIYTVDSGLLNHSNFVGGVEDGICSASAMFLKYTKNDQMTGYVSDLQAQKAYFFFNDEIVCLGAGINASDDDIYNVGEVYTIVGAHNLAKPDGSNAIIRINGEKDSIFDKNGGSAGSKATVFAGTQYIHIDNFGGYYFPGANGADITIRNQTSVRMGQIYFNHGAAPSNQKYAYVIMPSMSAEDTAAYAANPDVEILQNSSFVSAVREKDTQKTGYVFWYGTYFDGIRTTAGAIIMKTQNEDGSMSFKVCDPTQMSSTLTITLDGEWDVTGGILNTYVENGKTVVVLNTNNAMGATFSFEAKAK